MITFEYMRRQCPVFVGKSIRESLAVGKALEFLGYEWGQSSLKHVTDGVWLGFILDELNKKLLSTSQKEGSSFDEIMDHLLKQEASVVVAGYTVLDKHISKDFLEVGCQKIPFSVVKRLYERMLAKQ